MAKPPPHPSFQRLMAQRVTWLDRLAIFLLQRPAVRLALLGMVNTHQREAERVRGRLGDGADRHLAALREAGL